MKVLIVDDAKFMQKTLTKVFEENNIEVVGVASNGIEAVKKYGEMKPDAVIMDVTMPDMDGIQAVREIKKIDTDAKIIMCSAIGQECFIKDAILAGAKDYVIKPINAEKLVEALLLLK